MSFKQSLTNLIETHLENYTNIISERYGLNRTELLGLWGNTPGVNLSGAKKSTAATIADVDTEDLSPERLYKCNKAELSALCKAKGVKCTGNKSELLERLMGDEKNEAETKTKTKTKPETVTKSKSSAKGVESMSVVKKLTSDIPPIIVRKNAFGNFVHPSTRLVFKPSTDMVIGKEEDDGTVTDLTDDDIETCKQYKFKYIIPDNLDGKANLDDVKVEELDEESDIEIVEEEAADEDVLGSDEEIELEDDDMDD